MKNVVPTGLMRGAASVLSGVVVLVAALLGTACRADDGDQPPITVTSAADARSPQASGLADGSPSSSPASPAVSTPSTGATSRIGVVTGPGDPASMLAQGTYGYVFVADLVSGLIYRLEADYPCWIDDSTLVASDGTMYALDGATMSPSFRAVGDPCGALPADRLVPRAGGRSWENPASMTSADGLWTLVRRGVDSHIVGPGQRTISVPNTDTFAWSPSGHLLAIGGGWCGHEPPLQFVDPDSSASPLVASIVGRPLAYVWRPDGSSLITSLIGQDGALLASIRASDAAVSRILENGSAPIPLSVSPSGTRVLFYVYIHRHCS